MVSGSLDESFWKGKKVLLTGHTGFKGGWLALWLNKLGANVIGLSLPPEKETFYNAVELNQYVEDYFCDIGDYKKVAEIVESVKPEIVFHLAAQPLVLDSYKDPIYTYHTNVMGTLHLLEASRKASSVKAFVNITTDKCYENNNWEWGYRENDPLGGYDPYSSSKACSEILTSSYRRSFFSDEASNSNMQIASVRAGNVFGGGDWSDNRLIPDAARALSKQETMLIRNPHATRPWQFVLEPLRAYIQIAEKLCKQPGKFNEAWNIGPEDKDVVSVEVLLKLFFQAWSKDAHFQVENVKPKLHEQSQLKLDSSKIKSRVGWEQRFDLEEALAASATWYKAYYKDKSTPKDLYELSLKQISSSQEKNVYSGSQIHETEVSLH